MKKTRLIAAILSVVMLAAFALPAVAREDTEEYWAGVEYPKEFESAGSAETLKGVLDYAALRAALLQGFQACAVVDISNFNIPYEAAYTGALSDLIFNEMPEAFHIKSYSYSISGGKIGRVSPSYNCTAQEYQAKFAEVEEVRDRILEGTGTLGEVEKALLIHDRLALVCQYEYNNSEERYNMYGALVQGSAVCQGYAEAYDYLIESAGMESYICESNALNHAWNIIKVNGKFYHVDVTWDDYAWQSGQRGALGSVIHDNFLRSSAGMVKTKHTASDYDTYPTDTTYDSYFWQNSNTAFQLVGNEIYYIDNTAAQLKRYSDQAALCSVADTWRSSHGYWGNYARLASSGKTLFFSQAKGIYKYDLAAGKAVLFYQPTLSTYNNIYGLDYIDGYLTCDINDTPPYSSYGIAGLYQERVLFDETAPTAVITAGNEVAPSQQVTLTLKDNVAVAGYYWGTSSNYAANPFTAAAGSAAVTVTGPGTYYLTVKDTSGNLSATQSVTFYKTTLVAPEGAVSPASVLTAAGNSFTFPTPERRKYVCTGWALSPDAAEGAATLTPTGNSTYYALWTLKYPYDIDGNEEENTADVVRLLQYLNGWKVEIDPLTADVDRDGQISLFDAVRLMQILAA